MTSSSWAGKTIGGRYEIQELIGQGGMSAVYKAFDPNLRRIVAVKIIHPHLSGDAQFVHRFEEEAAAVARLRHPNLIQVYDFNNDGDTYYIVFEYVPGETIQARLKRLKTVGLKMEVDEVVDITTQVADGLQNAHKKGLIHRDIKPTNIIINVSGNPIIMDFGIAKMLGGTQHTATGAVLGTARYMSPEQVQGEDIDPRTDIYSLGITLFEMLGGRPPFEANSAMTLMMMHITDPVPDLNAIRPDVSPELAAVVNKSLAKKPDDRFQSAAQMAAALRNVDQKSATDIAPTMFETPVDDLEKTVVEPVIVGTAAFSASTSPAASATIEESVTAEPEPVRSKPAESVAGTGPPKSGSSRSFFYIAGALVLLLLIAGGIWAVFFRDAGGGEEVPVAAINLTETPDAAATAARAAEDATRDTFDLTRAADEETAPTATSEPAQEQALEPTDVPALEPTDVPAPDPTDVPAPDPTEEVAEPTSTPEPVIESVAAVDTVEGQVLMITASGEQIPLTADTPITVGSQFITGPDGQLELTLQDDTILQMLAESHVRLDALGSDPATELGQTAYTIYGGDLLARIPPGGSEQAVFGEDGLLLATLSSSSTAANPGKQIALARRVRQSADGGGAMSVSLEEIRVFIGCFSGTCTTANGNPLAEGWEKVITKDGSFISSYPITTETASYNRWQVNCEGCLPQASAPLPTPTPTERATATTEVTATPTATTQVTATPTTAEVTPTPTAEVTPEATAEVTPEVTAEATPEDPGEATPTPEQVSYAARITDITLENGRYYVYFETIGYTATVPGQHVHFYFDTVAEADAGVPGSGPWKLYGGPSPFTEYAQSDHVFTPTAMCIRVANEDHSIIFGSGNCFPLPQ